ncbi:MAG TPA: bifunctional pyr operon transcriptional regulator/uracil phosphoribosyltransferase PyrR [Methylophilus sp.]|nr:bifunctional pyr operon transcriptional regulator/uracil phosphoribosyltransferase PyrR [Methylophilus sp.]HQQ33075.1 bifunctional pyr operon transcriptional regulator/uracil phosphoribosyltransferase PyrR [Methylophilus sp.]
MQLPDPEQLLANIAAEIAPRITANTALVGVHSGGVWLMKRILETLDSKPLTGALDAAMYRDDFAQRGLKNQPKPADIQFEVEDKHIILIDDIFFTGRTTRAAMNELFDYGRPAKIELAVLINRGGAELPIKPDITGAKLPLDASQTLELSQNAQGKLQLKLLAS